MSNSVHGSQGQGSFINGLETAVRENPVSAALVGMGVLWLFFGGSKITTAAALLPNAVDRGARGLGSAASAGWRTAADGIAAAGAGVADMGRNLSGKVQEGVESFPTAPDHDTSSFYDAATQMAHSATDGVIDRVTSAGNSVTDMAGTLQSNLAHTFERQPLVLGAIGLAIGAGIGAAFASTQMEGEMIGDTADKVKTQVQDLAAEQADKLSSAARRAFDAVKEEAQAQGLTPAAAREGVAALGEKVKSVAGKATTKATS
jgi:hypothetical protein